MELTRQEVEVLKRLIEGESLDRATAGERMDKYGVAVLYSKLSKLVADSDEVKYKLSLYEKNKVAETEIMNAEKAYEAGKKAEERTRSLGTGKYDGGTKRGPR